MKAKFSLYVLFLLTIKSAFAQTYSPIAVTGFTHDVFAEAGTNSAAVTSTTLDATNHIMYTTDFATTNGITGGVSPTGTFTSGTRTYQIAPYTGNNAIYMSLNGTVAGSANGGTLTVANPVSYSRISFLSFSTEGTSTLNVVLTFTDGTVFNAGNFVFQDWFGGPNFIVSSIGRIARQTTGPYPVDGLPTNPRWYAADIPISCANQNKLLQSIQITYISQGGTSGRAVALAVSGVAFTPLSATSIVTAATCGAANGSINVSATGGTAPLAYTWNTTPPQFTSLASNLSAGNYTVTITDANGCTITKNDTVTQSSAITATASASPVFICSGDTATLTATASSGATNTYTWAPGNVTGQSIRVSPADTTTYTVTVTDPNGCSTTATVTLPVNKKPVASFTAAQTRLCMRNTDSIVFTGTAASNATYSWNFGNATVQSGNTQGPYVLGFPTSGTYPVTLTVTQDGCSSTTVTQNITIDSISTASFTASPLAICSGDTVQVSFTGTAATSATPNWNWGGGTVLSGSGLGPFTIRYNTNGNIQLIVTNNTCIDSATAQTIIVTPKPTATFTASAIQACTPGIITFTNTSQNAGSYRWSFGDTTTSTQAIPPPHTYTQAGTYNVSLTTQNGNCSATSNIQTITIVDPPVAAFASTPTAASTPIQLSQAQFSFTNQSTGATSYKWYFGDRDSSTQMNPSHRYTTAGSFTVTLIAYNSLGCLDSILLSPYVIIPDSSLRIPNAFSPNGDGINDTWVIPGLLGYSDCRMEIFDRYGQVVFSSTGYNTPWNGTRNGKPVPIGTYYYILRTSIRSYNGWVFIVR